MYLLVLVCFGLCFICCELFALLVFGLFGTRRVCLLLLDWLVCWLKCEFVIDVYLMICTYVELLVFGLMLVVLLFCVCYFVLGGWFSIGRWLFWVVVFG